MRRNVSNGQLTMFPYRIFTGLGEQLLRLMHQLLLLPTDHTLARDSWDALHHCVYDLRTYDRNRRAQYDKWFAGIEEVKVRDIG